MARIPRTAADTGLQGCCSGTSVIVSLYHSCRQGSRPSRQCLCIARRHSCLYSPGNGGLDMMIHCLPNRNVLPHRWCIPFPLIRTSHPCICTLISWGWPPSVQRLAQQHCNFLEPHPPQDKRTACSRPRLSFLAAACLCNGTCVVQRRRTGSMNPGGRSRLCGLESPD